MQRTCRFTKLKVSRGEGTVFRGVRLTKGRGSPLSSQLTLSLRPLPIQFSLALFICSIELVSLSHYSSLLDLLSCSLLSLSLYPCVLFSAARLSQSLASPNRRLCPVPRCDAHSVTLPAPALPATRPPLLDGACACLAPACTVRGASPSNALVSTSDLASAALSATFARVKDTVASSSDSLPTPSAESTSPMLTICSVMALITPFVFVHEVT